MKWLSMKKHLPAGRGHLYLLFNGNREYALGYWNSESNEFESAELDYYMSGVTHFTEITPLTEEEE